MDLEQTMGQSGYRGWICLLLVCACLAIPGTGGAQEVVAVLSSELPPYLEALEGFQEAFGKAVRHVSLASGEPSIGPETRVVAAFGGKAALKTYPEQAVVIYCLSPGIQLAPNDRRQDAVKIPMLPRAGFVISRLREFQPALKSLVVFWISEAMAPHIQDMGQAASSFGMTLLDERLASQDDLPERLRWVLRKGADGLWLPPDPVLINARSFALLKAFCQANRIPLYVPTSGLVEQGAVASVSCSFREMGRTAGKAAREALLRNVRPGVSYPEVVETTLNLNAAANIGLQITPEVLSKTDRVVR